MNDSQTRPTKERPSKISDGFKKTTRTSVCEKHGEYKAELLSVFGSKEIYSRCPTCDKAAQEEQDVLDQYLEQGDINKLIHLSEIPKRFTRCTLENYKTSKKEQHHALKICRTYLKNFDKIKEEGVCLTFCGKPGTGKTHLACAIANELLQKKVRVRYIKSYNALQEIKTTYNKNSELSERAVTSSFVVAELLIIDEVGVQYGSDADKILLYQIINGRYERMYPTILISNLTKEELIEYIGERSMDRLKEGGGVVIPFTWGSYRK